MNWNWFNIVLISSVIRLILLFFCDFNINNIGNRIEFSNVNNNYNRVLEGLYLNNILHISPYSGDVFHQPPGILALFHYFPKNVYFVNLFYFVLDIIISYLLLIIGNYYNKFPSKTLKVYNENNKNNNSFTEIKSNKFSSSFIISSFYLLNPFQILSNLSCSTSIINNLFVFFSIQQAIEGHLLLTSFAISIAIYLHIYPLLLIPPLIMLINQARKYKSIHNDNNENNENNGYDNIKWPPVLLSLQFITLIFFWLFNVLFLSYLYLGSNNWIFSSYFYIFSINDLTPNIGFFWYFFAQIFDRFHLFFLIILHTHFFVYWIPLSIRFKTEPIMLCWSLFSIYTLFQCYPTVGDIGLIFNFGLINMELISIKLRRIFPIVLLFLFSSVMFSCMWFLWIVLGSGNANFAYFQSLLLLFSTAFFIIEGIGSVIRLQASENILWKQKQINETITTTK